MNRFLSPFLFLILLFVTSCTHDKLVFYDNVKYKHLLPVPTTDLGLLRCGNSAVQSVIKYYNLVPLVGEENYEYHQIFLKKRYVDTLTILLSLRKVGIEAELGQYNYQDLQDEFKKERPVILIVPANYRVFNYFQRWFPFHSWVFVGISNNNPCIITPSEGPLCMPKEQFMEVWKETNYKAIFLRKSM